MSMNWKKFASPVITDRERSKAAWAGLTWPAILVLTSYFAERYATDWWKWLFLPPALVSFLLIMGRIQNWVLTGQPKLKNGQIEFGADPIHAAVALQKLSNDLQPPDDWGQRCTVSRQHTALDCNGYHLGMSDL